MLDINSRGDGFDLGLHIFELVDAHEPALSRVHFFKVLQLYFLLLDITVSLTPTTAPRTVSKPGGCPCIVYTSSKR